MRGRRYALLAVGLSGLCLVAGSGRAGDRGRLAGKQWRGWDRYQVIMWSTGEARDTDRWIARLREMGCTAEECYRGQDPAPFVRSRFGFYVENLVPELAFLHSRRPLYDADFQGYTATHEKRFLIRKPCLDDPAFWQEVKPRLQSLVRPYLAHQPLLYNLQDELSIGSFASPMDYCFGPHTLAAFRRWLQGRYGSLAALNREWETRFGAWDEVEPMTTYEIKARERAALSAGRPENYAPWADHREYMDLTFAQALDRLRGSIRALDARTPVGIEGTQMPSAWGGYDLWRLSRAIDWVEPYDIAGSREIFRSFLPPGAPVLGTVFGSDLPHIRRRLWWLLLLGDRGCLIWDDEQSRCVDKTLPEMPLTPRGKGLASVLTEIKAAAPKLFPLAREDDRVAIHYSQASLRAHWMFDSREDGESWPRRLSSYEAAHSRFARVRDSFARVVEDLGLQYNFVSYEQIENGELRHGGYKLLLLPQSVAMSPQECRQVEGFVRAGGTVIADNMTATMDEHCRRLPAGQLDTLFGIHRRGVGWRAQAEGGALPPVAAGAAPLAVEEPEVKVTKGRSGQAAASVPAVIERRLGRGRAVYLNLDMHDYGRHRLVPPAGQGYTELFRRLLREAGVEAPVKVVSAAGGEPAACVEVWRYRGEGAETIALMRNPEFETDSLGAIHYPNNAELEKTERVRVLLPRKARVVDLRTGKALGLTDRVTVDLDPWSPTILELHGSGASAAVPAHSRTAEADGGGERL